MERTIRLYVMMQRRRVRFSMMFFLIGVAVFLAGAVFAYLQEAEPIAVMLTGITVWASSIVYHLHDVSRAVLDILEEGVE